jgi:hypothetical protein
MEQCAAALIVNFVLKIGERGEALAIFADFERSRGSESLNGARDFRRIHAQQYRCNY